jgi:hypothetical protein
VVVQTLKKNLKNDFRQPRDLLNGQSESPAKKSQLTLYPGDVDAARFLKMMMMR